MARWFRGPECATPVSVTILKLKTGSGSPTVKRPAGNRTNRNDGRWADQTGLVSAGADAPDLDPDHDGIPNLFECILGGEPLGTNDSDKLPFATLDDEQFIYSHRLSSVGSHLQSIVESGPNLVDWQTAVDGLDGIEITPGPDDLDGTPTVLISFPSATDPRLFVRLAVSSS